MTGWQVTSTALTPPQVAGTLALAEAATAADGIGPLSEHVLLHLRYDGDHPGPGQDFVVTAGGDIVGYAYLDPPGADAESSGELVVHPARRRQGIGRSLLEALITASAGHPLRLWAHGDLPAATRLAGQHGFERFRALWQMRRPLDAPLDEPVLPPGRVLRTFVPGQDEDEWLALNGRAFAKHPEQGAWTRHDLDLREREPWFDPAGFFVATHDGDMTGFHWTKVHPAGEQDGGGDDGRVSEIPVGEVYVVGVDPAEQGSGLGRALTLVGLRHLRDLGLGQVMLYVDEDNTPAIRMYQRLGFERTRTDAMYRRPPGSQPPR
ncbi:MAG: mycothiol synthase [Streptosporangiaceae bacterium]